jgi:hypothetical protein
MAETSFQKKFEKEQQAQKDYEKDPSTKQFKGLSDSAKTEYLNHSYKNAPHTQKSESSPEYLKQSKKQDKEDSRYLKHLVRAKHKSQSKKQKKG